MVVVVVLVVDGCGCCCDCDCFLLSLSSYPTFLFNPSPPSLSSLPLHSTPTTLHSPQDQYVSSLYVMFTTLSTTGYGDIVPVDDYERIVMCFIMMLAATVVAFIVANVTTVVDSANKHETVTSDRITEINEFLREKNCSSALTREITAHFTQVFKNETQYDEIVILARLPPIVRNKVLLAEYQQVFDTIPLFKYIPNTSMKVHLLRCMQAHVCHKGRQIIKEGEKASEMTFMVNGRASICKVRGAGGG